MRNERRKEIPHGMYLKLFSRTYFTIPTVTHTGRDYFTRGSQLLRTILCSSSLGIYLTNCKLYTTLTQPYKKRADSRAVDPEWGRDGLADCIQLQIKRVS